MTSRELQARRSFSLVGEPRVLAFLRAIRGDGFCLAVRLVNEQLDKGELLESIFFDGEEYGYTLAAKSRAAHVFHVSFGCQAGPLMGDGGEWTVEYDAAGTVTRVSCESQWIS